MEVVASVGLACEFMLCAFVTRAGEERSWLCGAGVDGDSVAGNSVKKFRMPCVCRSDVWVRCQKW